MQSKSKPEKKLRLRNLNQQISILFTFLLLLSMPSFGQIKLPRLIQDGMILQRETPVKIWGWASFGETVTLHFNGHSFKTTTGENGKWQISLPGQKAGGPFTMEIAGSNRIELKDILFGDVWVCSGQSNMEYPMNRLTDRYAKEIEQCENKFIRQFKVTQVFDFNSPKDDYPSGNWMAVNPKTILDYSAVAYFFARNLYQKYHVPIGIINASVGGSPAEAWMSVDALKDFPAYLAEAEKFKNQSFVNQIQSGERKATNAWYARLNQTDKGLATHPTWKEPAFDASSWPTMPVPSFWADHGLGEVNGVVWFRKEMDVPNSLAGKKVWIRMGRIVDADSVFINGKFVGTTSYQYPQRKYAVPAGLLQSGKNTIVVRVINNSGRGGFIKDKPYQLFNETDTIQLSGNWQYQLGCTMSPTPGQTFVNWKPTGLYNGMLAPANKYAIKGAVWYQGESNAERYQEYQKLLTALIADWRLKHNQGNFPFIIAQLPNFMESKEQPSESNWAMFRSVQLKTSLFVENTAITVNIDLGDWNDIHPQNKEAVGGRLALAAERIAYHEKKAVTSGPVFQSFKIIGHKIVLSFNYCGSGLVTKDGKSLNQFAIAGTDGKFVWAQAKIEGKKVVVWNDAIPGPVSVRYAWADNPAGANLFNKEGLPATPFDTGEMSPEAKGQNLSVRLKSTGNNSKKSAYHTGSYRNLFLEAGYSQTDIDKKIEKTYYDLFEGPNPIYFAVGDSMAYVSDIKNKDARTEGLSYGMMIAVQLNKKEVFDRIWRWTKKYLQHQDGSREGFFAWSINPESMKRNSEGSASDGELYFITDLLFASNRWGNKTGIDYYAEARRILDAMWKKDGTNKLFNLINVEHKQITFVPEGNNYNWTDPSYHLPAFYEIWAEYAKDGHEQFYRDCADTSRLFLHRACHPVTGLNSDYSEFSGKPHPTPWMPEGFRYDSWRVPMNIAIDYVWYGKDKNWQEEYATRLQNFLRSKGINTFDDQFNLDGSKPAFILQAGGFRKLRHSLGLVSTAATTSLIGRNEKSLDFMRGLWESQLAPYEDGYFDPYYDGLLYLFSLLHLSGQYRIITPGNH